MDTTTHPSEPLPEPNAGANNMRRCRGFSGWYIAGTIFAFIVFWPLGLAMLVWAVWGDKIRSSRFADRMSGRVSDISFRQSGHFSTNRRRRPDNVALAEYLEREQQRLKAEQEKLDELVKAFGAFREAEQRSKDQTDFDEFLRQRDQPGTQDSADQSRG